jgi:hypothetical protein
VSHAHDCANIGGFPETNPQFFERATAFTSFSDATIKHNSTGNYFDWFGNPAPKLLNWYPTLATGTFTGQNQAAWSITGNTQYISLGGEFPTVNGTAQAGLVRFAVRSIAPNKVGPRPTSDLNPTVTSTKTGEADIVWHATFDQDDNALNYQLVRDGNTSHPVTVNTRTGVVSEQWNRPRMSFADKGLASGSTHTYRIFVVDPHNNSARGSTVSVTVT